MKVKPYPKYKSSGIEWLGKVPEGWKLRRLKQVASVFPSNVDKKSYEDQPSILLCNYTDVYYNDTITSGLDFMAATASPEQIVKFSLRAGDTIITKDSEMADDIAIAAYVPHDIPGVICGYHLAMIRPLHGTFGGFMKRFFDSNYAKSKFATLANGLTRVGLGQYALDNVEMPFPSYDEQVTIASFLDRETAKIDTLIAKQEKLVELLKEKRQAVISHAVTKGLDPSVPMTQSGVEWFGDVPGHWKVTRLGWITTEINDINHEMPQAVDVGVPFLSAKDLLDSGELNFTENIKQISEEDFQKLSRKIQPRRNDIIYSRIGARLGKARLVETDVKFLVSYSCCVVRLREDVAMPGYICKLLDTDLVLTEAKARTNGIGVPDLGLDEIARFPIPLPPISEQVKIMKYLEQQTARFSKLIAKAERATVLQKEHRSALISAAVTGKIDVRDIGSDLQQAA